MTDTLTIVVTINPLLLGISLVLCIVLSYLYDRYFVAHIVEESNGAYGIVAGLVVVGVGYTLFIAGTVFGLAMISVVTAFFIASGTPMIIGSYYRNTPPRRRHGNQTK